MLSADPLQEHGEFGSSFVKGWTGGSTGLAQQPPSRAQTHELRDFPLRGLHCTGVLCFSADV